jgi:hypothetical protein
MFPAQLGQPGVVPRRRWLGQLTLDRRRALQRVGEPIAQEAVGLFAQTVFFPNFWRKRSMRPAVSMNFCLPV